MLQVWQVLGAAVSISPPMRELPCRPSQRLPSCPSSPTCQARNFVQAARDERGTAIGAKAQAI